MAPVYDLYGVVNHFGSTGAGHYMASVRAVHDNRWYCFDDSSCRELDENALKSASASLLFYRLRSMPWSHPFAPSLASASASSPSPVPALDMSQWALTEAERKSLKQYPGSASHR